MAKIMISSTSEDLVHHRDRLQQTLQRLKQTSRGMEFFGAVAGTPVEVCKHEVDEADIIVLVVAHRYGWVPSKAQGGDGVSSITRIEYLQARQPSGGRQPKPVLAFLAEDTAEWAGGREQDKLLAAKSPDEALEVFRTVQALKDFKTEINSLVRDTFSTPDDLANKAGSAVANWLLAQEQDRVTNQVAHRALHGLMETVDPYLQQGLPDVALAYLDDAYKTAGAKNQPAIADKRLEVALLAGLSLYDDRLTKAAQAVIDVDGRRRTDALLVLGKCLSQAAREAWRRGERIRAWELAGASRMHLEEGAAVDHVNPDIAGTLGGLLKRMAAWSTELYPDQTTTLEDDMLEAYRRGSDRIPHAYPLLNYLEQRAILAQKRSPTTVRRSLIGDDETGLRIRLGRALQMREAQLANRQDKPWAAFDLARGRHYLRPNVTIFLEDLETAVDEARLVARVPEDRFMVLTTRDSLEALARANVKVDGLAEGIDLLESAVKPDDWFVSRPRRPTLYLEKELLDLRASITETMQRQTATANAYADEISRFIHCTGVRWSPEDEALFQLEFKQWKRDLSPCELKVVRGLWKVLGARTPELLSGSLPIDWQHASKLLTEGVELDAGVPIGNG